MKRSFPGFGLLVILLLFVFSCGSGPSWQDYQKSYRLKKGADFETSDADTGVEKKVIEVAELGIRDRCASCHVGLRDVSMFGEPNPLRPHPGDYLEQHPAEKFGCTSCHGGDGAALNTADAHAGDFRAGEYAQISCAKCHTEEKLVGAPSVSRGIELMKHYQCVQCHYTRAISRVNLFRPAPLLRNVGNKLTVKWLMRWLRDPKSYLPNARMPRYEIEDKYVDALAGYLLAAKQPEKAAATEFPEGDPGHGKGVLRRAFCITCHPFNERGGKSAPDLGRIGNKVTEAWIAKMLSDTHAEQPNSTMPQYNMTDQQYADIAANLLDQFTDWDMLDEDDTTKVATYWPDEGQRVEIGRRAYKELRCANCHGQVSGEDNWLKIGPDLSFIGDKPVDEINFGKSTIPRTLPDYLFEKVKNPQAFVTESNVLKMPRYDLSDEDVKDIVLALMSFNADTVSAKEYRRETKGALYEPAGDFGKVVNKFRCFSCHSFKGRGNNITYDLSLEGSRVNRKWLYDYLKLSYTLRPILTIRMPIFNMTDAEAATLTDGLMTEMVSSDIPSDLDGQLASASVEEGKQLFDNKGCLACHQVGTRGGYVGPSFSQGAFVGDKLKPGWIFSWLKNPQAIKPDVLEPNYGLSDDEALKLTAYLMSMKSKEGGNVQGAN